MKNLTISLILLILCTFSVFSKESTDIHKVDKITVGISAEYPPFEFYEKGKLSGFDVELMQALGNELGITIEFKEMAFNSLIPALQTNHLDAAISSFTITEQRKQNIDFSTQYYENKLAIIYPKSKKAPTELDLANANIGVQLGSTMEVWIKEKAKNANLTIITLDSNPPLIEKLKIGHLDYVIVEEAQAIKFCQANSSLSFSLLATTLDGYGIAFKKGSELVPYINQALNALEEKGILAQLKAKWFGV